jgi:hypothetical protein
MASGSKNNAENLPTLPSKITGMGGPKNDIPETANFEYTIKSIPINGEIPLGALKVAGDMQAQLRNYPSAMTNVQVAKTRDARFNINAKNSSKWYDGRTSYEFIDELMAQVPGKDNFAAKISDHVMGELTVPFSGGTEALNTGYYSRYYSVLGKDASGRTRRKRGFNDGHLWAAQTNQPRVAGLSLNDGFGPTTCSLSRECVNVFVSTMHNYVRKTHPDKLAETADDMWSKAAKHVAGHRVKQCPNDEGDHHSDTHLLCRDAITKAFSDKYQYSSKSWAGSTIPTPTEKNPTCGKLHPLLSETAEWKKCKRDKTEQKWSWAIPLEIIFENPLISWNPYNLKYNSDSVCMADGRDGSPDDPAKAFDGICNRNFYQTPIEFFKGGTVGDAADSARGTAGVLDREGVVRKVAPSGIRVNMNIKDIGTHIRQRYPVFPLHVEGSAIWKELKSLEAVQLTGDVGMTSKVREEAMGITFELTFTNGHVHTIRVDGPTLVTDLAKEGSEKIFTSSLNNGHEHEVTIRRVADNKFQMIKIEPPEPHTLIALGEIGSVKETGVKTKSSSGGSWGSDSKDDSKSTFVPAKVIKQIDTLVGLVEKLTKRIDSISADKSTSSCADMNSIKDMVGSLTKAVAAESA